MDDHSQTPLADAAFETAAEFEFSPEAMFAIRNWLVIGMISATSGRLFLADEEGISYSSEEYEDFLGKVTNAIEFKTIIQSRMFRYRRPSSYTLAEIRDRSLFMFSVLKQNDPLEYNVISDPTKVLTKHWPELISDWHEGSESHATFKSLRDYARAVMPYDFLEMEKSFIERASKCYIACFSETARSAPMWAHYAASHTGVCLEYDLNYFQKFDRKYTIWPVSYSHTAVNIWDCLTIHFGKSSISNLVLPYVPEPLIFPALFKHPDWSYEREYRLVWQDAIGGYGEQDRGDGFLVDNLPLKAVYLGKHASKEFSDDVRRAVGDQQIEIFDFRNEFENEWKWDWDNFD